jgi:hypothetical protein
VDRIALLALLALPTAAARAQQNTRARCDPEKRWSELRPRRLTVPLGVRSAALPHVHTMPWLRYPSCDTTSPTRGSVLNGVPCPMTSTLHCHAAQQHRLGLSPVGAEEISPGSALEQCSTSPRGRRATPAKREDGTSIGAESRCPETKALTRRARHF